jgi:hypothetical protein
MNLTWSQIILPGSRRWEASTLSYVKTYMNWCRQSIWQHCIIDVLLSLFQCFTITLSINLLAPWFGYVWHLLVASWFTRYREVHVDVNRGPSSGQYPTRSSIGFRVLQNDSVRLSVPLLHDLLDLRSLRAHVPAGCSSCLACVHLEMCFVWLTQIPFMFYLKAKAKSET